MKKSTVISLLIAIAICIQFNQIVGQVRLRATQVSFLNDTSKFYETNSLTVVVRNMSSQVFTGSFSLYYQTDSVSMPKRILLDSNSFQGIMLKPSDSITIFQRLPLQNFQITPKDFKPFHNIIVIWPIGSGIISEQGQGSVYVNDTLSGIAEKPDFENDFIIYPNPANSIINLVPSGPKYSVETVRIYNSLGSLIRVVKGNTTKLDVSSLCQGLYLLEIETNDNKRIIKRIMRE